MSEESPDVLPEEGELDELSVSSSINAVAYSTLSALPLEPARRWNVELVV